MHCVGAFVDIDEDRLRATISNGLSRCHEGAWDRDYFIAQADPTSQQWQPNRFGSATQTNRIVAFAKGSECLLKIRDRRAAGENATIDHFGDRSFKMAPQRSVMGFKI